MAEEEVPDPTLEEFVTWLTPASALEALDDLSDDTAVRAILTRASNGLVLGAATSARWRSGGKPRSAEIMAIPQEWWGKAEISHTWHSFWTVGDMVVRLSDGRSSTVEIHLFDVRFDPVTIGAITGGLLPRNVTETPAVSPLTVRASAVVRPAAPTGPQSAKPKIDRNVLKDWIAGYAKANPGSSFRAFLTNARLAFPSFHVPELPVKDAIAELKVGLSVGNPLILRKNRRIEGAD